MSARSGNPTKALPIILTVIFIFLCITAKYIPPYPLLFLFFFSYIVLLPGYLLSIRLLPGINGIFRLLVSFLIGISCLYIILFIFAVLRVDITFVKYILPIIVIILVSTDKFRATTSEGKPNDVGKILYPPHQRSKIVLFILIALTLAHILTLGDPFFYTSDSMDHMAYIRTISTSHEVFPDCFYYKNGEMLTRDIRKGVYHSVWGTINALTTRYEVHEIWPLISIIGSVFIILALFCSGQILFRSSAVGIISVILFLLFYRGTTRGYPLITINYPFPFGKIFFLISLSFLPYYLKTGKKGFIFLILASALAATWTHIAHILVIFFILVVFSASRFFDIRGNEKIVLIKRSLILAAFILLTNLPYLSLRYLRDYAPNNVIHTHSQGLLNFSQNFYILNPVVIFLVVGPLGLLSVLSIFIMWKLRHQNNNLKLLLHSVIAFYILILNPLWVPFIFKRISYLLLRFEFAAPSMIITAYLMHELWVKIRGKRSALSGIATAIGWIFLTFILGYSLVTLPSEYSRYWDKRIEGTKESTSLNLSDLYNVINKKIPRGNVIASDPITSYCIPAFTDQFVACPYDQHSTPNDSTALTRIIDCRTLYNPFTTIKDISEILNKYDADYLVINGRIPEYISTMYWNPDAEIAERISKRLQQSSDIFEIAYSENSLTLFRYNYDVAVQPEIDTPFFAPFVGDSIRIQDIHIMYESGKPSVRIKDFIQNREVVKRGDTLRAKIHWVADRRPPVKGYIVYIRFDTEFKKGPLYNKSYGKIYRKLYEKVSRRRYRFRVDHQPLNGIFPPDTWPILREIKDPVEIVIPRDISPGLYTVSVKLAERAQYPNYTLKEILTDKDFYSGVVVSQIIIE